MSAKIIDGKAISNQIREELKQEVQALKERGVTPGLAVILVGDDPASQTYVRNKERACQQVGFYSRVLRLSGETTQAELLREIEKINNDGAIHGLLVQLPLPKHIDEAAVIQAIAPEKDVDGFHPINVGLLLTGGEGPISCTPKGCIELLKRAGVPLAGRRAVIVGRSNIVGKPMAVLLLRENCTVTICHSKTVDLPAVTREADILVVAIGRAKFVTGEMIKPGAAVIDVGMDRDEAGKLCGDVDFAAAAEAAGYITPVPGGVGPMTITMLLQNTLEAAKRHGR